MVSLSNECNIPRSNKVWLAKYGGVVEARTTPMKKGKTRKLKLKLSKSSSIMLDNPELAIKIKVVIKFRIKVNFRH